MELRVGDERNHRRVQTRLRVACEVDDRIIGATTRDLSVGGMFIRTQHRARPGSPVRFHLELGPDGPMLHGVGIVRRSTGSIRSTDLGLGLEIVALNPSARLNLERFVSRGLLQGHGREGENQHRKASAAAEPGEAGDLPLFTDPGTLAAGVGVIALVGLVFWVSWMLFSWLLGPVG